MFIQGERGKEESPTSSTHATVVHARLNNRQAAMTYREGIVHT